MSPHAQQSQPQVIVNGEALPAQTVQALQSRGVQVAAGRYWYDAKTGAWGFEGHGTAGVLMPGLPLGGPLRADASRGSTGVFINGRQLPMTDVMALQAIGIPAQQGRFWCDAQGNCGREGQAWPLVNLYAAAKKARGGNGKSWYHKSGNASDYTSVGGDGKGFSYVTSKSSVTGKTTSYYFGD